MIGQLKSFLRIVYTTKNWVKILCIRIGLTKEGVALFRNGYRLEVNKKEWSKYLDYMSFFRVFPNAEVNDEFVRIKHKERKLIFYFGKLGPNVISEVFGTDVYKKLLGKFDVEGRQVVDVGAYIGDSAIFFGLMGARRVYGFEPIPLLYDLAVKNIKENNMEGICQVVQSAVGAQKGSLSVNSSYGEMLSTYSEDLDKGERVPVSTLEEIVRDYKIDGGVLKLDCEGYEYDIILNTDNEILRNFDYIVMEYHFGFESLKHRLENAGFLVECTKPLHKFLKNNKDGYRNVAIGYLTARKQ